MTEDGRIRVLSDSLINKIAAGEVLERPASAVKELLENSIDAEATRIRVELEAGGRSLIRVVDNGAGMSRSDAVLALKRHATSKIRTDADLFAINTLGFRGEALPSIAEVSRFELETGREGDPVGTRLLVDGGEVRRVEDAPNPGGTDIQVRRLFFNTPVRLKFLKTPRTEMAHVTQAVTRLAMAHPHIAFELVSGGRKVLDAPQSEDLAGRLSTLLGRTVTASMHTLGAESADLRAEGMISDPTLHRSNNVGVHLFVNGRYVRDRTLIAAVLGAYKPYLPRGRYPVAVLFVDVPPDQVDVNVHPAKTEVRFRDSRRLYRFLNLQIEACLREVTRGPRVGDVDAIVGASGRASPRPIQAAMPLGKTNAPTFWGTRPARLIDQACPRPTTSPAPQQPLRHSTQPSSRVPLQPPPGPLDVFSRPDPVPSVRLDGSEHPTFSELVLLSEFGPWLLCADGPDLIAVDPGAARERVLFESLCGRLPEAPPRSQRLLVPTLLDIAAAEVDVLMAFEPILADVGAELSSFGGGTLSVHALPAGVDAGRARLIVEELAATLRGRPLKRTGEELRGALASVLASHCAEAASARMLPEEVAELFSRLDRVDFSQPWPHGRPIVARWERAEVEARFGKR